MNDHTPEKCSTEGGCPFAFTEESAMIQNYGCLPTTMEIITMRIDHGKTWACHMNSDKPCAGAIKELKRQGLPYKVIDAKLITENYDWSKYI